MKVIVAPDSFKGNLTALQVAEYIEEGIKAAVPDAVVVKVPVADGGEGTVEALVTATGGSVVQYKVHGPLMQEVESFYGILGDGRTAVIEMAAASGLAMVPDHLKNPMNTTTYGVGELIKAALDKGFRKIVIGIGGSSTNDGGIGMAQALGVKFYDKQKRLLEPGQGGKQLLAVDGIDISGLDSRIRETEIIVACDVKNPLYGTKGAAYVYGPQKGASPAMVKELDEGLKNYSEVVKRAIGKDVSEIPGAGAAGGLGGGLIAYLDAVLKPGIETVVESVNLDNMVKDADLVITGEGKTDFQTAFGKVPVGIAMVAKNHGVPVVCLSGGLGDGYEEIYKHGIDAAFSNINMPMSLQEAMAASGQLMVKYGFAIANLYKAILKHKGLQE